MKIMFHTSSLGKGGAERVISILANKLVEKHQISILVNTLNNIAYGINKNVKLVSLDKRHIKCSMMRHFMRMRTIKKEIIKEKPDIIITFLPVPSYRILILRNRIKIPIIVSDRNDPEQEYKSKISYVLMKLLYKRADGFVFQTKQQQNYFSENIQKKSTVILNPIKDEFIDIKDKVKENTIINVGRLVNQKKQKMLIKSFSQIADKYKEYNMKIFGDGPLKEKLQIYINSLGLQDRVELCGISNDIKIELEKSKVFVLSSDYEGMPNALMEAMVAGVPSISTDCPCGRTKRIN